MRRRIPLPRATLLPTIVLALLVLFVQPAPSPAAAADERCFPETGFCIAGRFRAYWEQQGGLAVFGFPVSAPRDEMNREDGRTYLTQWFERVRFEAHPENAPPYDVLLGRIGVERLQLKDVSWQNLPRGRGPAAAGSPRHGTTSSPAATWWSGSSAAEVRPWTSTSTAPAPTRAG